MLLPLIKQDSVIVLPDVQLTGPFRTIQTDMMLDTGASYCMLSWKRVLALGYSSEEHRPMVSIGTVSGIIRTQVVILRKIVLEDIVIRNVPVFCHDLDEFIGISGLIGLNALKNICTTIDYRRLLLRME